MPCARHLLYSRYRTDTISIPQACKVGIFYFILFYFILFYFRAASVEYGCPWARGQIRDAAAGLHHNHNNAGSVLYLQPMPQLSSNIGSFTH